MKWVLLAFCLIARIALSYGRHHHHHNHHHHHHSHHHHSHHHHSHHHHNHHNHHNHHHHLHQHQASTTRFSGVQGSCGGCDINLVGPLSDWVAAATPDSMQVPFDCHGGNCPHSWCATGKSAAEAGKIGAGCGSCFKARSIGTNPWRARLQVVDFHIVVVDSCPFTTNQGWCPKRPGDRNKHGFEYHFDLVEYDVNKLGLGDNPIIEFSPMECPPHIVDVMSYKCCGIWWTDQGCPRRNESGCRFYEAPFRTKSFRTNFAS